MKRILTLAVCLGLVSVMAVEAKDKGKGRKNERKAAQKFEKQERKFAKQERKSVKRGAKFDRREVRGRDFERNQVRSAVSAVVSPNVGIAVGDGNRRLSRAVVSRRGPANYSWSYDEARRYYTPGVRRDRSYYSSRYDRFALFAGGYYYFDRGYWYPAYGYDNRYSTYRFDEPIYGYNSLEPQGVIVNVQRELRREGYYRGSIDGMIGPMTREALARYQRDRGIYVTRAIDGPTLAALGLT
ncbi:MAG: peptidoglycan-binding protein [Chthoniobacterales bacterium]